jgi:4-carboxymuconolactone decarboxylase
LERRLVELSILTVARFWGAEFEWHAHKPIAVDAGLAPGLIEQIRMGTSPNFDDADLATVHEFSKRLLEDHEVEDKLYARALDALGEDGVVDLVGILGYYSLVALTIKAFNVPLPDGVLPELS